MHVQATEARKVYDGCGKDNAIGDDADDIGIQLFKLACGLPIEFRRGVDGHPKFVCGDFHIGGDQRLSAAPHGIWPREYADDLVLFGKRLEHRGCERGRSHEDDAHYFT